MTEYYAEFRLAGIMVHERFCTSLEYVMGLHPYRVRDESGRNVVFNYKKVVHRVSEGLSNPSYNHETPVFVETRD